MLSLETPENQEYAASLGITEDDVLRLQDAIRTGHLSLAETAGFSAKELEALHARGMQLLAEGFPFRAGRMFLCLVQLNRTDHRYWRALGLAFQYMREFGWAKALYDCALALAPKDVISLALRGECLLYVEGKKAAHQALTQVLALSAAITPEEAPHVQRARAVLAKIVL